MTPVEVARLLGTTSRQVHSWAKRRATSKFPDPVASLLTPVGGGRRRAPMYDADDVLVWWLSRTLRDQCTAAGCPRDGVTKGMCRAHYAKVWRATKR